MKAELIKGHLDGLILAVLEPAPLHGYAVIEALREHSSGLIDLPSGTIYPALHRLERSGLIASEWTAVSGRRRRVYSLTGAGRNALKDERETWQRVSTTISTILRGNAT
jgi:PadR family transcriptional regulator, regulatory protein PadR